MYMLRLNNIVIVDNNFGGSFDSMDASSFAAGIHNQSRGIQQMTICDGAIIFTLEQCLLFDSLLFVEFLF